MKSALILFALLQGDPGQPAEPMPIGLSHGPFQGHTTPSSALVWARATKPGTYQLRMTPKDDLARPEFSAQATLDSDLTLRWSLERLESGKTYEYRIHHEELPLGAVARLRAAPALDAPQVRLAFASCANEKRFPVQAGWKRMVDEGAQALILLGDMPYIDSTDLAVQRRRYREFYAHPSVLEGLGQLPFYATWDDHDFGRDDTDGRLPGKENSRQAFEEYHANPGYGEGGRGIYTSFRRGPIEVFLLDTRSFAGTEPSPVDGEKTTLLGEAQLAWLKRGLTASSATFKVLASGMIWNGATRPGKKDHWMTYPHERQAIFEFIGEHGISGVLLVGGDIHRSRALRYPTRDVVGYDLVEFISSPLANTVIESANAPSPHLLHDVGESETFLLLDADLESVPASLTGRCLNAEGEVLFEVASTLTELSRP